MTIRLAGPESMFTRNPEIPFTERHFRKDTGGRTRKGGKGGTGSPFVFLVAFAFFFVFRFLRDVLSRIIHKIFLLGKPG
jgi:hypothetical protein